MGFISVTTHTHLYIYIYILRFSIFSLDVEKSKREQVKKKTKTHNRFLTYNLIRKKILSGKNYWNNVRKMDKELE